MRILIADDHPERYEKLVKQLGEIGTDRKNIFFSISADDAQTKLESNFFDLFILDILLPLFDCDEEVSHENSLLILNRINNEISLVKPGKVIGITSDIKAAGAASDIFSESTWSIINYSQVEDEWIRKTINCVKYIKQKNESIPVNTTVVSSVDLAIICALETPELDAVMNLPWNWGAARPIDDLVFVRDGWLLSKGKKITVAAAFASRMGMVSTALKSFAVIAKLNPKIIAMTGICAGVKGQVSIGDVLFADPAWDFQSGKRVRDSDKVTFSIAPHQLPANYTVRTHIEQLRSDHGFLNNLPHAFQENCEFTTKIKIGPVASGSAVLADGESIEEIKKQQRELVGVEMEIYGLYAAAMASSPQPKFFALKGVCDYADPDKVDKAQEYAAFASARVLQKLFEEYGARCLGDTNGY